MAPTGVRLSEDVADSNFKISRGSLCQLMETSGQEAVDNLKLHGGISGLCTKLITSPTDGITADELDLAQRRELFGSNYIQPPREKSLFRLVLTALKDTTLIILLVSAFISLMLSLYQMIDGDFENEESKYSWIEGVAIIVTVAVIVLVTAVNNYSKGKQFRNLKKRLESDHLFAVLRNGVVSQINVAEIVVGDICLVKYGDILPADGVVVHSSDLNLDESNLTGESQLVPKSLELDPILFSGTRVMEGSGKMLVAAVGIHSKEGIILALCSARHESGRRKKPTQKSSSRALEEFEVENKHHSVLQTKLNRMVICMGYLGFAVAILTIIILIAHFCISTFTVNHTPWNNAYLNTFVQYIIIGITILVVAIPEGLPLAVTLALAYSVKKMMDDYNLVRHLDACETMGNATTICSDKTGTLTTNRMTVVQAFMCEHLHKEIVLPADIPKHVYDLIILGICVNTASTSELQNSGDGLIRQIGNKTECALLGMVQAFGEDYKQIRDKYNGRIVKVFTFNSIRKSMSTIISIKGGYRVFTKGASEVMLKKCSYMHDRNGEVKTINNEVRRALQQCVIEPMCAEGLRTMLLAYKDLLKNPIEINHRIFDETVGWDEDYVCSQLTFLGIFGIEDPVRPDVPEAIRKCQRAGITVRMVTGDSVTTARAIAIKCGIITPKDDFLVIDSKDFNERIKDNLDSTQQYLIDKVWPKLRVLARSSPLDKYILVKGIINSHVTRHREVVAVTGDGTNDGPALKIADVGFAMGIAGTDVAKEASDIILTDDNFSNIVKAVMWGRNVYDNISKFIQFQLTVNLVAVMVEFIGACTIQNCPLKAVQMLWINLIMDSLAALALATESPTEELLTRKPYGRTRSLVSKSMLYTIIGQTLYQLAVLSYLLFICYIDKQNKTFCASQTQQFTIIFNTLVMMTLFNELNARKLYGEYNIFSNMLNNYIFCSIWCVTFIIQILVVQFGSYAFSTTGLSFEQWMYCVNFGMGSLTWQLLVKVLYNCNRSKSTRRDSSTKSETRVKVKTVRIHTHHSEAQISVTSDDIMITNDHSMASEERIKETELIATNSANPIY